MKFLSNYLDFIFEAVAKKEMRLYYSDEFRNLLTKIQSKSSVAQALLSAEDSNQMLDIYTLIDITDKNDTISLIQVNRIIRDNPDLGERLPYNIRHKKSGWPSSEFWNKARTEMKIGRWTKRIFTEVHKTDLSDSKIEEFVNLYKSSIDGDDLTNLELVRGEDIRKWYLYTNYEASRGQLGNSCMRYSNCQDFLDIYVKNPEFCQLLILKSEDNKDKIKGRALVWKLTSGDYYMDRIYTINDSDKLLFKDYARVNKMENSYDGGINETLEVKLGDYTYEKYPYMDTFVVYNPTTKILRDDEDLWPGQGYINIQNTNGGFGAEDAVWSEWEGEYINRENAVRCANVEDWLSRDSARYLEYKDEWAAPTDEVVWSQYHGEYFFSDDTVYSDLMSDNLYPDNEDVIEVIINSNGDNDWCIKSREDLYIKVGNDYYSKKECIKDPFTNEYKFKDKDYQKSLDEKLMKEFGIEINEENYKSGQPTRKTINLVKEELESKLLKLKLSDKIKKLIEQNEKYKNILHKYKSYQQSVLPTEEDIFILLKSYLSDSGLSYKFSWRVIGTLEGKFLFYGGDRDITEKRFDEFRTSGIIKEMIDVCASFDLSEFPEDIYKRYVFLSF
jgi:hypothetical protein